MHRNCTDLIMAMGALYGEAAEQPPPIPSEGQPEVLTRGPVNEAFAQPVKLSASAFSHGMRSSGGTHGMTRFMCMTAGVTARMNRDGKNTSGSNITAAAPAGRFITDERFAAAFDFETLRLFSATRGNHGQPDRRLLRDSRL
jgi:hypothetical protein